MAVWNSVNISYVLGKNRIDSEFYKKEDVMRIYGFTDELYSSLENYIVFPQKKTYAKNEYSNDKAKSSFINSHSLRFTAGAGEGAIRMSTVSGDIGLKRD